MATSPPSLALIYARAVIGVVTKTRRLPLETTTITSVPPETLNFSLEADHVREYKTAISSSHPSVPFDYVASCYLNSLPLNMLTSSGFPLNVVGSVHEATKIEAFRSDGFGAEGAGFQACSRMAPEIEVRRGDAACESTLPSLLPYDERYVGDDRKEAIVLVRSLQRCVREYVLLLTSHAPRFACRRDPTRTTGSSLSLPT